MRNIILVALLSIFAFDCKGQANPMSAVDSASRNRASLILKDNFGIIADKNDHILFSIADRLYLIIFKEGKNFKEFYFEFDAKGLPMQKTIKVVRSKKILYKAFDKDQYQQNFISLRSSFFSDKVIESDGNPTYFYLMKNGVRYGESKLSVFIKPCPFSSDIYYYLCGSLLKNLSANIQSGTSKQQVN